MVWDVPNDDNEIYLTFDDGPTPEVTPWVLLELKKHNALATFFCIGDNINKHPELFLEIIAAGHSIGNHTFNHLNGFKTPLQQYAANVQLCATQIQERSPKIKSKLFRPPYGKIKPLQARYLRKLGYKIILWDIISHDFDLSVSKENCLKNATYEVQSGSIIVFHDSIKASENLKYALPLALNYFKKKGFVFAKL